MSKMGNLPGLFHSLSWRIHSVPMGWEEGWGVELTLAAQKRFVCKCILICYKVQPEIWKKSEDFCYQNSNSGKQTYKNSRCMVSCLGPDLSSLRMMYLIFTYELDLLVCKDFQISLQ